MSIYDALKDKGSTGGRNIEEAIRNLPEGGGGGGGGDNIFVVNATPVTDPLAGYILDKTYAEIEEAFLDGQQVVLYGEYTYIDYDADTGVETYFQHQRARLSLECVGEQRSTETGTGTVSYLYNLCFSGTEDVNIPTLYSTVDSKDAYPMHT